MVYFDCGWYPVFMVQHLRLNTFTIRGATTYNVDIMQNFQEILTGAESLKYSESLRHSEIYRNILKEPIPAQKDIAPNLKQFILDWNKKIENDKLGKEDPTDDITYFGNQNLPPELLEMIKKRQKQPMDELILDTRPATDIPIYYYHRMTGDKFRFKDFKLTIDPEDTNLYMDTFGHGDEMIYTQMFHACAFVYSPYIRFENVFYSVHLLDIDKFKQIVKNYDKYCVTHCYGNYPQPHPNICSLARGELRRETQPYIAFLRLDEPIILLTKGVENNRTRAFKVIFTACKQKYKNPEKACSKHCPFHNSFSRSYLFYTNYIILFQNIYYCFHIIEINPYEINYYDRFNADPPQFYKDIKSKYHIT